MLSAFICGGNWNNGAHCGARAVNLNNYPWNVNTNIGSRLACDESSKNYIAYQLKKDAALYGARHSGKQCLWTVYQITDLVTNVAKLNWPPFRGKAVFITRRTYAVQ